MTKTYNEMTYKGKKLWWRRIGHRGGVSYEVGEPAEAGKGRKIIRRNVGYWAVNEFSLLKELAQEL